MSSDKETTILLNLASNFEKKKNYNEMKKYYMLAIGKGNNKAMCNLGKYYYKDNYKYFITNIIKYFLIIYNYII